MFLKCEGSNTWKYLFWSNIGNMIQVEFSLGQNITVMGQNRLYLYYIVVFIKYSHNSCLASFQWDCCDFWNPVADQYSVAWQQPPLRIVLGFVKENMVKVWFSCESNERSRRLKQSVFENLSNCSILQITIPAIAARWGPVK